MNKFFTLSFFLIASLTLMAQKTMDVTLKITYRNNPLCFWDVTIKHGDVELAKGKTDDKGVVKFKYVRLLSLGIDAYGYKKTDNGDKKWDVKGYIVLNEDGTANFDFEKLLQDTGMPQGLMEAAWGLTLNDCNSGGGSSSGGGNASSGGSSSSGGTSGNAAGKQADERSEWQKEQDEKAAQRKAEQDQFMEDWQSGKSQAEALQQQKTSLEGKIEGLNGKISRRQTELSKLTPGSKEHSDLAYEVRELELDRDLATLKLEKVNKEIANNNSMLAKEQRQDFKEREEIIKNEQDKLKADQKAGKRYGVEASKTETGNETGSTETDNDDEDLVVYTEAEIANMSTVGLQRAKMSYNTKVANRRMSLKTKAAVMKQDKKARLQKEIDELSKAIELMDAELAKRKAE